MRLRSLRERIVSERLQQNTIALAGHILLPRIRLKRNIQRLSGTAEHPVFHPFEYANTYVRERLEGEVERLRIGLRDGQSALFRVAGPAMTPPFRILYILHTSRVGTPLGRYESPELGWPDVESLERRFGRYFAENARHDVRLHSTADAGTLNPTDRGKVGVKRSTLVDGRGVPLSVVIAGANVHDRPVAVATLDGVVIRAGRGIRRPRHLCLDRGYDAPYIWRSVRARRITPHIRKQRKRGEPPIPLGPLHKGKPRRWVVERTGRWYNRFRGLLIRWERKAANYEANVQLAIALIALQQAQ